MIIREIRVQNFRCIKDATLPCEQLTALVGPNGVGKSAFLRALNLFYTLGADYTEEDFYDYDTENPIRVTVTFGELTPEEEELFRPYIDGDTLTVEKELTYPRGRGSEKYHGSRLQNPDFAEVRSISQATPKRQAYNKLSEKEQYSSLPSVSRAADIEPNLQEWENQHPDALERMRDEGQFFGFKEVGSARLERFTSFLFVPAVRDAAEDAVEGRGSVLTELMDLVVRSVLAQREELRKLQSDTQERYESLVDPTNLAELNTLAIELTGTLQTYVPNAAVELDWLPAADIELPMPKANVRLVEDGFPSPVDRTGHGLQRAFILTMLQHLAVTQAALSEAGEEEASGTEGEGQADLPSLILGIEEPELYQHPSRQRYLSRILYHLATGGIKGVAGRTQVIYSTHSPLFVGIERFEQVRVLRKELVEEGKPKQTRIRHTTLDQVAKYIEAAQATGEKEYSGDTLRPRLTTLMTPWMNEGFFADAVVLVEGEGDRAAVLGVAHAMDLDFESVGISVIPCMGKTKIDRPYVIFRSLGIPAYVLWDTDYGCENPKPDTNRRLLRLLGEEEEDWPDRVETYYACFKTNLEERLAEDVGHDLYETLLNECMSEFDLQRDQAVKYPQVISTIISKAEGQGKSCRKLKQIVQNIWNLQANANRRPA